MKRQIWISTLILLSMAIFLNAPQAINIAGASSNIIELMYAPISNRSDGEIFTLETKLKVKNTNPNPIYNVKINVSYLEGMTIDTDEVYLGDINPGEIVISSESFVISYTASSQTNLIWQVEYTTTDGNQAVENISLKETLM